jgi:dipeptidyl aminopeptidase/acylaminoacyl peptidase
MTSLNADLFANKQVASVEALTFVSNDNKFEVEAFLTKPLGMTARSRHPLIVNLHGGPHGQNGPGFNFKDQAYAAKGQVVLHVNHRGSTGYGQKFADAVFGDQNGNEAQDVLYGVNAAVHVGRRNGRALWKMLLVPGDAAIDQINLMLCFMEAVSLTRIPNKYRVNSDVLQGDVMMQP